MKQQPRFHASVAAAVIGAATLALLLTDLCCAPNTQNAQPMPSTERQADAPPVLEPIAIFETARAANACTVYSLYPNSWGEYSEFAVVNGRERALRFRQIVLTFWHGEQVCAVRVIRNVELPANSARPVFFAGVNTNPPPDRVHAEFVE